MSDSSQTSSPVTDTLICPQCHRKLLTQASVLCNWCGAKIDDPEYQAKAAETRQALDQQEKAQIEAMIQEEARFGILGRLKRRAKTSSGGNTPFGSGDV